MSGRQKHSSPLNLHTMTILESIEQKVQLSVDAINGILPEGYFTKILFVQLTTVTADI